MGTKKKSPVKRASTAAKAKKKTSAKSMKPADPKKLQRLYAMPFGSIYPLYVQKAEKKGRTRDEVDEVISWLTGYSRPQLQDLVRDKVDFQSFFANAPLLNPNASLISGVVCGVRIEEIQEPLMKKIRYLDKLVDELAQGRPMQKILR